ncbi:MAG TPA: lanthionine synthetase LanC family protein [Longimicrobium sp.]|nr:lanthionine synthetase LanC family protein [Longimicrobium sp.]
MTEPAAPRDPDRKTWLDAAVAIADGLCADARWEGDACTWAAAPGQSAPKDVGGRVDDGTAGIALFLLRLHEATGEARHRDTARAALSHSLAREREGTAAPGYFAGTAGVAAICAELGKVAGDDRWIDHALALCRAVDGAATGGAAEVAAGDAGSVLGLLRVHALTQDAAVLACAVRLGDALLAARRREPEGISWNGGGRAVFRNLLGLPHGAGGIGMALLELYRATGEERFAAAAIQALQYEDSLFDAATGSWPDLRHPALAAYLQNGRLAELRREIASGRFPRATPPPADATWRHGATGIALVRAHFFAVTGLERYRDSLARAAARCREDVIGFAGNGWTLAQGVLGSADALLESARHIGCNVDSQAVADLARRALEAGLPAAARTLPPGLLSGAAGIGHFFLRMALPESPSPLQVVPRPLARLDSASGEDLIARSTRAWGLEIFARTGKALEGAAVEIPAATSAAEFRAGLGDCIAALPAGMREQVAEAFAVESLALELSGEHADRSERLLASVMRPRPERLRQAGARVCLAASASLVNADYDWEPLLRGEMGLADLPWSPAPYLVHDTERGYTVQRLDGLAATLCSGLRTPTTVAALLDGAVAALRAQGHLAPGADAREAMVRERLERSLGRMYELGIVDIADSHGLRTADITSELCTRCGECCKVRIYIPGDATYREYVAAVLEAPLRAAYPEAAVLHEQAGGREHVVLDLGYCRHLQRAPDPAGHPTFRCGIYETRPAVCRSFNCVSWWTVQHVTATGRTTSDGVIEKVAALKRAMDSEGAD